MTKISVIIPNYNNGRFLTECVESVLRQKQIEKEIIIVDDGSTDDSISIIKTLLNKYKDENIRFVCQNNLNAAIARNKGLELASGEYVIFLDSDDILLDGVLERLAKIQKKLKADLLIGNYVVVDEKRKSIDERRFTNSDILLDGAKDFGHLMSLDPVPTNKLYDLKIIRNNKLSWGNVRIGQDLNFYLKYLSLCKKVALINDRFFEYRICKTSMTRTYDFRILDIAESFNDVKAYYHKRGCDALFAKYIPFLALKHFSVQMSKLIYFENRRERDLVVRYFSLSEKTIDYSKCSSEYKRLRLKFRLKCCLRLLYISGMYRAFKMWRERKNG